ncbi:MAG TPA: thermonuclease family protein [Burkholderiaceae bacterium]|nr:thermonuclease family protein [Burkholderiaceae bacterium]
MRHILFFSFLSFVFILPAYSKWEKPHVWEGTVIRVSDGDTLWVQSKNNTGAKKVRIEGIDAPEICQAYGKTSKAALQQKLLNKTITIDTRSKDDYGRDIAKLSYQQEDIGAWLVLQGHAWSYHRRFNDGMYAAQEREAKTAQRGLFAASTPAQEPRLFRKTKGSCFNPKPQPASK